LQERVAEQCENVKTYHSETGLVGGFVCLNSGQVSNEGSTIGQAVESPLKDKEALIITFWDSYEDHEASHKSETFQPLFRKVLELCENGNEEIAYNMLWSGQAYDAEQERRLRKPKPGSRYKLTLEELYQRLLGNQWPFFMELFFPQMNANIK